MSNNKNNNKPAVKEKYAIKVKGTESLTYPGKLDYAHQCGIKSIQTEIIQYPNEANKHMAICSATVITKDGGTFMDIADASPDNVPPACRGGYIRIASTRAKSRAISDAFNIIAQLDEDISGEYETNHTIIDITPEPSTKSFAGGGNKPISSSQIGFITKLCQQRGEDSEILPQNEYGKVLEELTGSEANELIQKLKAPF